MDYSLKEISTVEDCNALLASAHKVKEKLERKRRNLGEAITRLHERISHISTELASVQVLLGAFTSAYDAVPLRSRLKANLNVKIKRLEVRKARLDKRSIVNKVYSLLKKQVDYNILDRQVSVVDAYVASVQHKKMRLVVKEKKRPAKSAYSCRMNFSSPRRATAKTPVQKELAPFSTTFTIPTFKPMAFHWPHIRPGPERVLTSQVVIPGFP